MEVNVKMAIPLITTNRKLQPKLELPQKFSGENGQSVQEFIDNYELVCPLAGWDEQDQIKYLLFSWKKLLYNGIVL